MRMKLCLFNTLHHITSIRPSTPYSLPSNPATITPPHSLTRTPAPAILMSSSAAPAHAKQHVSFVVIGHSQCGKSTAVGAMLQLTNSVEDGTFDAIEAAANTAGQTMRRFAWISDKTKEERERLHTITPKLWCLDGDEHQMSVIDTPGHRSCTLMCIASMCMADAALVVVSGKRGDFEHGISSEGKPLPLYTCVCAL